MADLQVFIIRHGLAEPRGKAWPDDSKRPLSEDGVDGLQRTGRGLRALDISFGVLLSSPFVRASQTAKVLADAWRPRPPVVLVDSLAPGGTFDAIFADISTHARQGRAAIVGHEPGLGEFTAALIGLSQPLEFKKGAIARVDVDRFSAGATGSLRWLMPPRMLRALGQGRRRQ